MTATPKTATTSASATIGHQLSRPARPRVRADATRTTSGTPRLGCARRLSSAELTLSSDCVPCCLDAELGRPRRIRRFAARTIVERPSIERTLPATAAKRRPVMASRSHASVLTSSPWALTSETPAARPASASAAKPSTIVDEKSRAAAAFGTHVGRRARSTVAGRQVLGREPAASRRWSGRASSKRGSISRR